MVHALSTAVTHRMVRTSSQLENPQHATYSTRKLRPKLSAVVRQHRLRTTACRDIVVDENIGSTDGGNLSGSHGIHGSTAAKAVCDEQNVLATIARATERISNTISALDTSNNDEPTTEHIVRVQPTSRTAQSYAMS